MCRVYINYFFPYFNMDVPYFNWASDQWIHYAVIRDSIEHSYFNGSYLEIYSFFLPTFYMSFIGVYYLTNLSLIILFKWIPVFFGSFAILALINISKMISKNWNIAIISGILVSISAPVFLHSTSVVWPQLFGHYLIIVTMISFLRSYSNPSYRNLGLFIVSFIFLSIAHVVSAVVGAAIVLISFILISFKKGFDKRIFLILIPCYIFLGCWGALFYSSIAQFGINSLFDIIKYLGLGLVGFGVALVFLYFVSKRIDREKPRKKFSVGILGKILLCAIILIFFNPFFWYYFPLTKDMANFLPFTYFAILMIAMIIPLVLGIIGFGLVFDINKIRFINLLGWMLGIFLITLFFLLFGTFEQPSRTVIFILEPLTIYSSFYLIKFLKNKSYRKKLIIFLIISITATPLSIMSFTTTAIGSGAINKRSEVYSNYWYENYSQINETVFITDTREGYLTIGMFWNRSIDLKLIQNINYVLPENYEALINLTSQGPYYGCGVQFSTNFFVHENYYHTIFRSEITRLYITPELENNWTASSDTIYLRIYCSQNTEIYYIPFVNRSV
ncbi:MAG: hypothetical protein GF329_21070 [Candidatus Lokiarchaeota archaeon]|nr:hypothetical protein [Candidatus Lokiarchaeota archaeon]